MREPEPAAATARAAAAAAAAAGGGGEAPHISHADTPTTLMNVQRAHAHCWFSSKLLESSIDNAGARAPRSCGGRAGGGGGELDRGCDGDCDRGATGGDASARRRTPPCGGGGGGGDGEDEDACSGCCDSCRELARARPEHWRECRSMLLWGTRPPQRSHTSVSSGSDMAFDAPHHPRPPLIDSLPRSCWNGAAAAGTGNTRQGFKGSWRASARPRRALDAGPKHYSWRVVEFYAASHISSYLSVYVGDRCVCVS